MSGRWSAAQVSALAADAASLLAAATLGSAWSATGATPGLVWGLCAGSGKSPYQCVVDLTGPAYHCSCPSRKFPCKHALSLLLGWSAGAVPDWAEAADYAVSWQAGRGTRAAKAPGVRDDKAVARRAEQRVERVTLGLAELEVWLRDQIRTGLSGLTGYRHADSIAARMVDAQAPGVAAALRRLGAVPASGERWPERLLAEYAQLHLLVRAHQRLDRLPADLAAVVRARVGYTVARDDVLAGPAVEDRWEVLAQRDQPDATIPSRRVWLRGLSTGRYALLLYFDPRGSFGLTPVVGTVLRGALHFYPGQLRAVLGDEQDVAAATQPQGASDLTALLADWAAGLERDPWLSEAPALLVGTPCVGPQGWQFVDPSGVAVPLLAADPWTLSAVSGGAAVTLAGEWTADGLVALTVWHGDEAVAL